MQRVWWSRRTTPGSRRRGPRPTGSTPARWRACCGGASLRRCGCPMSAPACCGGGWRAASSWSHAHRGQERGARGADAPAAGQAAVLDLFGVKGRKWLARFSCRPRRPRPCRPRCGRSRSWTARSSRSSGCRQADAQLAGGQAADDRAGRESGRAATFLAAIGDIARFRVRGGWSPTSAWTRRSASPASSPPARAGSQSAARRRRAGRWSRPPGASSTNRAAARLLPAHQGAPRSWQGDRRRRAQARALFWCLLTRGRTTPTSSRR